MSNHNKHKNELGINHWIEPFHRAWNGGLGFHPYKNQFGGAFNKTKREFTIEREARNRKMKQVRARTKKS